MKDGQVLGVYNKQNLPNYSVFDEKRYFSEGHQHLVFEYLGHKFGVLICEDIWALPTGAAAGAAECGNRIGLECFAL